MLNAEQVKFGVEAKFRAIEAAVRHARWISVVIMVLGVPACSMWGGAPKGTPNFDESILLPPSAVAALRGPPPTMSPPAECDTAYGPNATATARDDCIKTLMSMVDIQYGAFRDGLLKMVDDSDLLADTAVLGLGSATALVPGATTKSILGAISAGVTGTKAAINSDILYNTSVLIIINQMDADRAGQRCTILSEMKNNTAVQGYTMYDASPDLMQYYEAGTFAHGLQALQARTGSQAAASKRQAADLKAGTASSVSNPAASTCSS